MFTVFCPFQRYNPENDRALQWIHKKYEGRAIAGTECKTYIDIFLLAM